MVALAAEVAIDYLIGENSNYIESLWTQYQQDPFSVDSSWKYFFEGMSLAFDPSSDLASRKMDASFEEKLQSEWRVIRCIEAYRKQGHLYAKTNPLNAVSALPACLQLESFGLSEQDLDQKFVAGHFLQLGLCSLREILARLHTLYCGTVGFEPSCASSSSSLWLQKAFENPEALSEKVQTHLLKILLKAETWEKFLHTRYVAQKRFSLEGAESTLVLLESLFHAAIGEKVQEVVMGMAHRGRINILKNLFQKPAALILMEFEGKYDLSYAKDSIQGDVKYHMGYSSDFITEEGRCHLSLAYNPSHLEFVNPVMQGMAYAKQKKRGPRQVLPIAIHGDAAFAGQGVCYETLTLSQLEGYGVAGTIHIVINNQIGFTTDPMDTRSTAYATDVMKMLDAPIFHVNADDPEAVWRIGKIALDYRQQFGKDICIDLIGYRRHGHNESDEPSFTQPQLYHTIKEHPSVFEQYRQVLQKKHLEPDLIQKWSSEEFESLIEAQKKAKGEGQFLSFQTLEGAWKGYTRALESAVLDQVPTGVFQEQLSLLSKKLNTVPSDFELHPKLLRLLTARQEAFEKNTGIDWGAAELLAYATLIHEGALIRLSGQDTQRGTFSHRHCVLHHFSSPQTFVPLNALGGSGHFDAVNSPLSETAVLGFEFGVASADPHRLVIWEAQFGDFCNGAQVIIDQFIATSEAKWQRMSGITLFLPHGYEGQGAEHSSARIERFLQQSGLLNWSLCNLTTPSQLFHGLRRQWLRPFRKPLVLFSPKSLLRHPLAVSPKEAFIDQHFQEVLDDPFFQGKKEKAYRIFLCSGKIYYDLVQYREKHQQWDVALIRIEQLYPWPDALLMETLHSYSFVKKMVWVQEEPQNMGAWSYIFNIWHGGLGEWKKEMPLSYVGRSIAAAPAVGSHQLHEKEHQELMQKAFEIKK